MRFKIEIDEQLLNKIIKYPDSNGHNLICFHELSNEKELIPKNNLVIARNMRDAKFLVLDSKIYAIIKISEEDDLRLQSKLETLYYLNQSLYNRKVMEILTRKVNEGGLHYEFHN